MHKMGLFFLKRLIFFVELHENEYNKMKLDLEAHHYEDFHQALYETR